MACSALGRTADARAEQAAFEAAAARVPADWKVGNNPAPAVLDLARHMLEGELLWREGDRAGAFAALEAGARLEDEMVYDEPPGWMQPVRHAWGALLMADDRPVEAEQVYRDDPERHPDNGWSLLGLREALEAQGRTGEADQADAALTRAWFRAEVEPRSSCFCEPGAALP
nr:TPR domain protein [uncultured bacterium]